MFFFVTYFYILLGNWWRTEAKNDLPLRTLKTLIFLIVQQRGDAILDNFSLIERVNESELSYYVQKSLRHYKGNGESISSSEASTNTQNVAVASPLLNGKSIQNTSEQQHSDRSPLQSKPVNVLANGSTQQHLSPTQPGELPDIRDEECLKRYVLSNAEAMQISLNWEDLKKSAVPISSIEEASRAVEKARQRLETLKLQCRGNTSNHSFNGHVKDGNLS